MVFVASTNTDPKPRRRGGQTCTICRSSLAADARRALEAGQGLNAIARAFGFPASTWKDHVARCLRGVAPIAPTTSPDGTATTAHSRAA
jgi:hypothetical protein